MGLANRLVGGLLITGVTTLATAPVAIAQEHVGVVTNLEGTVTVVRVALPLPQLLQFKDEVYLHDRITTRERSIVRVLLGGKATVTARERSVLTITEVPGVATINLGEGRISVAVSKGLMKRGEVIEIKTPNAVTAIRGTVVVAEVLPTPTVQSTISVLRGLVDVTRLDTDHRVGRPVNVGALQSITVVGSNPLMRPQTMTAADAKRLTAEFRMVPQNLAPAAMAPAVEVAVREAPRDMAGSASNGDLTGKGAGHTNANRDGGTPANSSNNDGDKGDKKGKGKGSDSSGSARSGSSSGNDVQVGSDPSAGGATVSTAASIGNSAQGATASGGALNPVSSSSAGVSLIDSSVAGGAAKKAKK